MNKNAYLRDRWNQVDCIIVCVGYIGFLPGMQGNYSVVRLVRLLRPVSECVGYCEDRSYCVLFGRIVVNMFILFYLLHTLTQTLSHTHSHNINSHTLTRTLSLSHTHAHTAEVSELPPRR
jgi:hypothetical protein